MQKLLLLILLGFSSLFSFEVEGLQEENEVFATPYSFRQFADFVLFKGRIKFIYFKPSDVFEGAVVFVKTGNLDVFFREYHPQIKNKYILLTHGGDPSSPREFINYLDDPKIIAWLSRNPSIKNHKKFHAIPIGMACRTEGDTLKVLPKIIKIQKTPMEKEHFLYLNISIQNYPEERQKVYDLFHDKDFCYSSPRVHLDTYFADMKKSVFVISPRGNGLDCFRTWEALYLGAIPILRSSKLDPLLMDLPVVIVKKWEDVTEEFLLKKHAEIESKTYSFDKLFISYWEDYIKEILRKAGIRRKVPFKNGH